MSDITTDAAKLGDSDNTLLLKLATAEQAIAEGGGGGWGGNVIGPASATDNAVVRFNLATGKLIQNSAVTISDGGDVVAATYNNLILAGTSGSETISMGLNSFLSFDANAGIAFSGQFAFQGAGIIDFGAGGSVAFYSDDLGVFSTTTSAQLRNVMSDETGTGALVFASGPSLSGADLSNCTYAGTASGLPAVFAAASASSPAAGKFTTAIIDTIQGTSDVNTRILIGAGGPFRFFIGDTAATCQIKTQGIDLRGELGFTTSISASADVILLRDAAGALALRNGSTEQEFRLGPSGSYVAIRSASGILQGQNFGGSFLPFAYVGGPGVVISGNFTATGTATTTFTVTIGSTMANATYEVVTEGNNTLSSAVHYVNNKTTTTFDVVYLGLTGAVAFDWIVSP